jgi:mannose-1-phosphate guanylyltransferase
MQAMVTTATSSHVEQNTNSNLHGVSGKMIDRGRADKAAAKQLEHKWAVILAGGDGTRLKSLSRRITGDERPKQFCPVMSDMSLVKETHKRVDLEVAKERTLFLLNRLHQRYYSEILGGTPAGNLIEQPRNIGTAPAILYSVLKIAAADPQAIIGFFPSDHYVSDNTKFMAHIRRAFEAAHDRSDLVILLGVEPESPEAEYGWIEPAQAIQGHRQLHRVRRFWEKPSSRLAAVLQLRGCLWNSFVMIASAQALIDIIASATPALYNAFASAMPMIGTDDEPTMIEKLYAFLGETNFSDRVLALVPERLAVLKVSGIKWNDLGEPKRVLASIQTAGVRPLWMEKC